MMQKKYYYRITLGGMPGESSFIANENEEISQVLRTWGIEPQGSEIELVSYTHWTGSYVRWETPSSVPYNVDYYESTWINEEDETVEIWTELYPSMKSE